MQTPPVKPGSPIPPSVRLSDEGLCTQHVIFKGQAIATFGTDGWYPIDDLHDERRYSSRCSAVRHEDVLSAGGRNAYYVDIGQTFGVAPMHIPRSQALPNILLRREPRLRPHANCVIDSMNVIATRDMPSNTPLTLELTPGIVIGVHLPVVIATACDVFDCKFLLGYVPCEKGRADDPSKVDGYLTMESMARLVCMEQQCGSCAVIGSGYGEIAALMAFCRTSTVLAFETVTVRRDQSNRLRSFMNLATTWEQHATLADYNGTWPLEPTFVWNNNIRYNDALSGRGVPGDLLAAPHFPYNGSVLVTMVFYAGESNIYVCSCGNCRNGCHYGADTDSVFIIHDRDLRCGLYHGFTNSERLLIRTGQPVEPPVVLVPYGAGRGRYNAVKYHFQTCHERQPTPQVDLQYTTVVMDAPSDLTPPLRTMLAFASEWLRGDLLATSMIFHGHDGEAWGIDCAVAFMVEEPGQEPIAYGYRTVSVVRECGVAGLLRVNHDVMKLRGKNFINQANLQLATVVQRRFPDATGIVIEPDKDVDYHKNYESGFYWRLDKTLSPQLLSEVLSVRAYTRYRKQIQPNAAELREMGTSMQAWNERFQSLYFEIPKARKRPRQAPDPGHTNTLHRTDSSMIDES